MSKEFIGRFLNHLSCLKILHSMIHFDQTLLHIISQAVPKLQFLGKEEVQFKASTDSWSKKEILGHLIDSAYNNHQRFIRAEEQGTLIFQGYAQNEWVKKNGYQNRSFDEIIQTWEVVNRHLAQLIAGLPADLLRQETTAHNFHLIGMRRPEEGAPSSLGYLIWDYIFHLEHHLKQLLPGYEAVLEAFEKN